jgi:fatty acid synthase subunit alpha
MVRLMFVAHEMRWIDISLRNLTGDWLRCVEERFAGVNGHKGPKTSILQSFTELDDPRPFLTKFFKTYPSTTEQLLATEDKAYFLTIAQRPGQNPFLSSLPSMPTSRSGSRRFVFLSRLVFSCHS